MNEDKFEQQVEQEEQAQYSEPQQDGAEIPSGTVNEVVEKVKELVNKGNVTKIVIKKGDNILVNIPVNVGIVGGIIGIAVAPWAIVAAAVATAGFDCKVELVKEGGEVVEVGGAIETKAKDLGEKARDVGAAVVDGIKAAMQGEPADDADFESVVEEAEAGAEEPPAEEPKPEE